MLKQVSYTNNPDSVYDAYVTEGGMICVQEIHIKTGSASPQDYTYIYKNQERFDSANLTDSKYVERNDEIFFTRGEAGAVDDQKNLVSDGPSSFVDMNTGIAVMSSVSPLYEKPYLQALYAQGNKIWCAMDNMLLEVDKETLKINYVTSYGDSSSGKTLAFLYKDSDTIFSVFEKNLSSNKWIYGPDSINTQEDDILVFNSSKVLLHIADGCIYWAEGAYIFCDAFGLNNDGNTALGENIFVIEMPENIIQNNILEIAGNWLFIHDKAQKAGTETNQLIFKVNLQTQEIVNFID